MPPDVPGGAGRSGRLADSTCCLAPAKPADTDPADCSRLRRLQPAPPAAAGRRRLAPAPRCTRPHLRSRRRLRRPACRPQDLLPHQPRPAPRGLHGARRTRPTTSSSTSEAAADTAAGASCVDARLPTHISTHTTRQVRGTGKRRWDHWITCVAVTC